MVAFLNPSAFLFFFVVLHIHLLHRPVSAQFGNIFEQFFQQQEDSGHAGHDHEEGGGFHPGSFEKHQRLMEQTDCTNYFCPTTFECVSEPKDCSCPFQEDIKCPIVIPSSNSDHDSKKTSYSFICTRAPGCHRVQQALKLGSL